MGYNWAKQVMNKRIIFVLIAFLMVSCASNKRVVQAPNQQVIRVTSDPEGAKVLLNEKVVALSTPADIVVPLIYEESWDVISLVPQTLTFVKDGYETGTYTLQGHQFIDGKRHLYGNKKSDFLVEFPNTINYEFGLPVYVQDPTIPKGEAKNQVKRENPGATALERTIIRWNFDSDPRGARVFWRVVSNIPEIVKNTNETYLGSTPYEDTRSFNILGLTYENSRDVQIEIKVVRSGYVDQMKRFNVRQAIDQQEISSFFSLVEETF
jgi:hypothetical protein